MNSPTHPRSLRDALTDASQVAPLTLDGPHRRWMLAAYGGILVVCFGGLAYTAATDPLLLLGGVSLCYALENALFVVGHVLLHAAFIELPERRMATLTHHAFVHHYRDVRVFQRRWLETRLSYWFCPRKGLRSTTTWVQIVPQLLTAGLVAAVDWRAGLAALSCMWLGRAMQSICHEWYHTRDREGFYTRPTRSLLAAMERAGVLSTRRHHAHHRHHLRDLDNVRYWADMYLPGADWLGDRLWARTLAKHAPGQRGMIGVATRQYVVFGALNYAIVAAAFGLAAG